MQKRLLFGAWLPLWLLFVLNTSAQVTQNPSGQWEKLIAAAVEAGDNLAEAEQLYQRSMAV